LHTSHLTDRPSRRVPSAVVLGQASTSLPWGLRISGRWQTADRGSRWDWCLETHHTHQALTQSDSAAGPPVSLSHPYPDFDNEIITILEYTYYFIASCHSTYYMYSNPH